MLTGENTSHIRIETSPNDACIRLAHGRSIGHWNFILPLSTSAYSFYYFVHPENM